MERDDEAHKIPNEKGQKKRRSTRSNKQASAKLDMGLFKGRDRTLDEGGMDAST